MERDRPLRPRLRHLKSFHLAAKGSTSVGRDDTRVSVSSRIAAMRTGAGANSPGGGTNLVCGLRRPCAGPAPSPPDPGDILRWARCRRLLSAAGGDSVDPTLEELIGHGAEERCISKGKYTPVLSHGPVAGPVRIGGDTDRERVERLASHGSGEPGVAEREDATVPRHEPVTTTVVGAGDPRDRGVWPMAAH